MSLESRYRELERSKEELLVEKGSTINRLAMELEEAQNRVATNHTPELKEKISQLLVERNTARMQIKDMAVCLCFYLVHITLCKDIDEFMS